jgi:hypothetical protein
MAPINTYDLADVRKPRKPRPSTTTGIASKSTVAAEPQRIRRSQPGVFGS